MPNLTCRKDAHRLVDKTLHSHRRLLQDTQPLNIEKSDKQGFSYRREIRDSSIARNIAPTGI